MQLPDSDELVKKKRQLNFSVPPDFLDRYREMASRFGMRDQWVVGCAGLVQLFKMPVDEYERLLDRLRGADLRNDFSEFLLRAVAQGDTGPIAKIGPKTGPGADGIDRSIPTAASLKGKTQTTRRRERHDETDPDTGKLRPPK